MASWVLCSLPVQDSRRQPSFIVLSFPALLQCHMQHTDIPSLSHASAAPQLFADVIVPRHIAKAFTYLVPPFLANRIAVGQCVSVPFGRTMLQGAVVRLSGQPPTGMSVSRLKPIVSLVEGEQLSGISPELFALSKRVADEYLAPWGQCLRLVLPAEPLSKPPPIRFMATQEGRIALKEGRCPEEMRPLLTRIARRTGGLSAATTQMAAKEVPRGTLQRLQAQQWVIRSTAGAPQKQAPVRKASLAQHPAPIRLPLSPEIDREAGQCLTNALQAPRAMKVLFHGDMNYRVALLASAARQVLAAGRSVLVIVGEVAKAEWLAKVLQGIMDLPVIVHHGRAQNPVSPTESKESPQLVVGTRSAIFLTLHKIGLIWIEGEDDAALKEPQEPRYHAREVAWMRAQQHQVPLVMGSSHPSLESMTAADVERWTQPLRSEQAPVVELVDLSQDFSGSPFSGRLVAALRETLQRRERAILFLNRKGYAGALVCRECGWVPRCASCAVALPYYRDKGRLTCRYCGVGVSPPDICTTCGSSRLSPVGEGTERVELEARRLFPDARLVRVEGSSARGAGAAKESWRQVYSGEWDILIGTQVLFQREPIIPVGLVGIVQADSGLHVPDFRAAERTYQLLIDAVSLGRPAATGGRAILQTALPTHHVMQAIAAHDPARFYNEELKTRQLLGYPPVVQLIHLSVSGKDRSQVGQAAQQWVRQLHRAASAQGVSGSAPAESLLGSSTEGIAILGPVSAAGMSPKGQVRSHIMVKGRGHVAIRRVVQQALETIEQTYPRRALKFSVDADPLEME